MYIDSHVHYDLKTFDQIREDLLRRIHDSGVEAVINCSIHSASMERMHENLGEYDWVYCSVGIHPNLVGTDNAHDEEWVDELLRAKVRYPRVVAIGETGLDYYRLTRDEEGNLDEEALIRKERQMRWFQVHVDMAIALQMPLVLHIRDAHEDAISMLRKYGEWLSARKAGVVHCFNGNLEQARAYMDMGFFLGIGGAVTLESCTALREAVREIPLSKLLLETDAPYVKPAGVSGKRNSSLNLPVIAAEIAKLKGITVEEIASVTTENAKQLFGL